MSAPPVHGYTNQPRGDERRRVPAQNDGSNFTGTWDSGRHSAAERTASWAGPADLADRTGTQYQQPAQYQQPVQDQQPSWGYADDGSWVGAAGASAPAGNEWWADAPARSWSPPQPPVAEDFADEAPSNRRKATKVAIGIGLLVALVVVGIVAFAGTVLLGGGSSGPKGDVAAGNQSGAPVVPGVTGGLPDMPQQPTTAPTTPGAATTTHPPTKAPTTKAPQVPGGALAMPVQEGAVLTLVNKYRGQNGCKSLSFDSKLANAARKHSADMADRHYFSHNTPEGVQMQDRITAEGYKWSMVGENIAEGQQDANAVMTAWMNSPGHRANILNCKYTQIGIGLAYQGRTPVWTQDFGTPR